MKILFDDKYEHSIKDLVEKATEPDHWIYTGQIESLREQARLQDKVLAGMINFLAQKGEITPDEVLQVLSLEPGDVQRALYDKEPGEVCLWYVEDEE